MKEIKIAPSLLSANFYNLENDINKCKEGKADIIHFDIMDGHFVPNITFGPMMLKALKPNLDNMLADVHLMIENVDSYIPAFAEAGADMISIHCENNYHLHRSISLIKSFGIKAGIVLNPITPLQYAFEAAEYVDFILLMSVNPGFGGQSFIDSFCRRSSEIKNYLDKNNLGNVDIEVDGGIKIDNVHLAIENGANLIVSGSGIFSGDIVSNLITIKNRANQVALKLK
ncbi:MAG TPA: ribulose-phosphate 3-epimerase [Candidatus Kapabacteria bacterium]|nr:ribulose-phosphate 3-epimerase [Candidatus Kapabacteria bacterium]